MLYVMDCLCFEGGSCLHCQSELQGPAQLYLATRWRVNADPGGALVYSSLWVAPESEAARCNKKGGGRVRDELFSDLNSWVVGKVLA